MSLRRARIVPNTRDRNSYRRVTELNPWPSKWMKRITWAFYFNSPKPNLTTQYKFEPFSIYCEKRRSFALLYHPVSTYWWLSHHLLAHISFKSDSAATSFDHKPYSKCVCACLVCTALMNTIVLCVRRIIRHVEQPCCGLPIKKCLLLS